MSIKGAEESWNFIPIKESLWGFPSRGFGGAASVYPKLLPSPSLFLPPLLRNQEGAAFPNPLPHVPPLKMFRKTFKVQKLCLVQPHLAKLWNKPMDGSKSQSSGTPLWLFRSWTLATLLLENDTKFNFFVDFSQSCSPLPRGKGILSFFSKECSIPQGMMG